MPPKAQPTNVAVVHDWLIDHAGAERVLEQILALYPDATLYTLIDRMPQPERGRFPSRRTVTSFLDGWPGITRYFTRCLPLMPFAVQQFDLSGHDLVISSSHCVAKGVIVPPEALHLCYCHTPMRYVWDLQATYLQQEGLDHGLKGWLARRLFHRLRRWDASSHQGVDHFAANSRFVRQRILKCWRRPAGVIHPPVAVDSPPLDGVVREPRHAVTVGRLMGYKNVALMLAAFRLMPDWRLTVVGDGPQRAALQAQAPPNVRFTGALPEADKQRLLQTACVFVFAAVEDFGIAPAEALAAGTPVVALARGGALDYLRHGENAWLFDPATPQALAQAVADAAGQWPADIAERCRHSVSGLDAARFRTQFAAWVDTHWAAWQRDGAAP
jgi:glycosyltransferase involved in cell wall biosynthesis